MLEVSFLGFCFTRFRKTSANFEKSFGEGVQNGIKKEFVCLDFRMKSWFVARSYESVFFFYEKERERLRVVLPGIVAAARQVCRRDCKSDTTLGEFCLT